MKSEIKARIGDYVTVKLLGEKDARQGVFVGENEGGNPVVRGVLEDFVGEGDPVVVPDKNLVMWVEVALHVKKVRAELGIDE